MSTDHITPIAISLSAFVKEAESIGWQIHEVKDEGLFICLTDGSSYVWCCQDGERVSAERFSGNNVDELVDHFELIGEHDDAYQEYMYEALAASEASG